MVEFPDFPEAWWQPRDPRQRRWDQRMMALAQWWSSRSTCLRARVGAVVATPDYQVLVSGYAGAPRGETSCDDEGQCLLNPVGSCIRTVHAERNCILQAARIGTSLVGASLFTTTRPCLACANDLVQIGIGRVLYAKPYETDGMAQRVTDMFHHHGIPLLRMKSPGTEE